jgi:hypothetical protein
MINNLEKNISVESILDTPSFPPGAKAGVARFHKFLTEGI